MVVGELIISVLTCPTAAPGHVWWPEYNEKLGAPLGKFARDGYRFTRHFEHLTVTADCETLRAEFNWH